ncbi:MULTISPECIES: formate dehydrogenase subunit gamma [unclassified Halomonas]|uniref:formate dehydrogenase subunit gamma n=1 Tax=unclassified Halomonas TaxID=2609666 RepID=UPI0021E3886B|nr:MULTISPECIES: formate dehydrogenase subunit gamma [unclassified Halomonas]UYG00346.1 formate dehydrogenase subunit gamma [Halomonas sp. GD1P12]WNL38579.1 formate dehydrogenase subunit gamma [Halomonas sp. PAMB 3232]
MSRDDQNRNHLGQRMMLRYSASTRVNHWTMALSFILLALSGLAFFHPAFFFLTHTLGGPVWARILHPFIGVAFFLLFALMAVSHVGNNLPIKNDVRWMKQIKDVLANRDEKVAPIGKYNPGQKLVFWLLVLCVPTLLITGVLMWRPWFAGYFPVTIVRIASLLHALAAFGAILTIVIHIYAAIWVKGSFGAMIRGFVTHAWAKHHHPLWYDDHVKRERSRPSTDAPTRRDDPVA